MVESLSHHRWVIPNLRDIDVFKIARESSIVCEINEEIHIWRDDPVFVNNTAIFCASRTRLDAYADRFNTTFLN